MMYYPYAMPSMVSPAVAPPPMPPPTDFNAVLDQFVQNQMSQSVNNPNVFSFKKLYSFPFYLNSDSMNIPFMKQHLRRQDQLSQAIHSSQLLANYLANYLKRHEEERPLPAKQVLTYYPDPKM